MLCSETIFLHKLFIWNDVQKTSLRLHFQNKDLYSRRRNFSFFQLLNNLSVWQQKLRSRVLSLLTMFSGTACNFLSSTSRIWIPEVSYVEKFFCVTPDCVQYEINFQLCPVHRWLCSSSVAEVQNPDDYNEKTHRPQDLDSEF